MNLNSEEYAAIQRRSEEVRIEIFLEVGKSRYGATIVALLLQRLVFPLRFD